MAQLRQGWTNVRAPSTSRSISSATRRLRGDSRGEAADSVSGIACAIAFSVLPLLPAAAHAAAGPVAAYGFSETAGATVTDSSSLGNTGTLEGATRVAGGKYGAALSFDGTNDRVRIPDSASLDLTSGMTLEAWVNPTRTPAGAPCCSRSARPA